jgi:hypothetical protein
LCLVNPWSIEILQCQESCIYWWWCLLHWATLCVALRDRVCLPACFLINAFFRCL